MIFEKLYETIIAGGWVLLPILLVGTAAFFALFRIIAILGADLLRKDMELPLNWFKNVITSSHQKFVVPSKQSGLSYNILYQLLLFKDNNSAFVNEALAITLKKTYRQMERGLNFAGVLASVAPLLGLLGTVEGMVATFITITRYGNSNPVLLADGISEALLTTQSGLLIAFPLLLTKHFVEDRIVYLQKLFAGLGNTALAELEKSKP